MVNQKKGLTRTYPYWHLDLGFAPELGTESVLGCSLCGQFIIAGPKACEPGFFIHHCLCGSASPRGTLMAFWYSIVCRHKTFLLVKCGCLGSLVPTHAPGCMHIHPSRCIKELDPRFMHMNSRLSKWAQTAGVDIYLLVCFFFETRSHISHRGLKHAV